MKPLRYTLRGDGPTDARLLPILDWLLGQHLPDTEIRPQFADLRQMPIPKPMGLAEQIRLSIQYFPCDLLFVHRDAEKETIAQRIDEIVEAVDSITPSPRHVPVVPVRMTEAWLLIDEEAIRRAAGNPNGRMRLALPSVNALERVPDPKETFEQLLREASGLKGRRLKSFAHQRAMDQLAKEIDDFSPLRNLPAFQQLERDVAAVAVSWGSM